MSNCSRSIALVSVFKAVLVLLPSFQRTNAQVSFPFPLPETFINCSFETESHGFVATNVESTTVARDSHATVDGSYCLRITKIISGGRFGVQIPAKAFEAKKYRALAFDYNVVGSPRFELLLTVHGRKYAMAFSGARGATSPDHDGAPVIDVDGLPNAKFDGKWHTVLVDLLALLRRYTRESQVDEMILVEAGSAHGSKVPSTHAGKEVLYLDNFKISEAPHPTQQPQTIVVDDFEDPTKMKTGFFSNPGNTQSRLSSDDTPSSGVGDKAKSRGLKFDYDVTEPGSYTGFWSPVPMMDLSGYGSIQCRLRPESGSFPMMSISILSQDDSEAKALVAPYASPPDKDGWCTVQIPLGALRGKRGLSRTKYLTFSVTNERQCGKGSMIVDDIVINQSHGLRIADFECSEAWETAAFKQTVVIGPSALAFAVVDDTFETRDATNHVCQLSYGGSIGADAPNVSGKSRCYWECPLHAVDAREFAQLAFRIRGRKGGEMPRYYLRDGGMVFRVTGHDAPLSTEWSEVRIDLAECAKSGLDLSLLEGLQTAFEEPDQSGTVFIDDLRFEPSTDTAASLTGKNTNSTPAK
ncbi:MAG: hypothetical protein H7A55_22030 [Verrucomicrobiaceae bacterium]|nr:hypothetical protein [Verrucomicrobiaceae bacterium]